MLSLISHSLPRFKDVRSKVYIKNIHQKWKYYREEKIDVEIFLIFLNIKISAKSNKIELSEKFMVMWKEKQSPEVFCKKGILRNFAELTGKYTCPKVSFLVKFQASRNF